MRKFSLYIDDVKVGHVKDGSEEQTEAAPGNIHSERRQIGAAAFKGREVYQRKLFP